MRQKIENHYENAPAYLVLCDYEIIPARTLEDAINLADSHFELIEIYKRRSATGPASYVYLCNVTKQKGGDLNGLS